MSGAAQPEVVLDEGAGGLAPLLEALMRTAVAREPRLARRMRGSLALRTTDVPAGATVRFEGTRIGVSGEASEAAWMVIEGESGALAALSARGYGLQTLRRSGVRLRGIARHPVFALRARRLLAASSPTS
ncbi:MAG: hypothetical protein KGJ43_07280 [Acidobacteriota bacterium]|nr:hypothetical protein [Acidobacteriota bacterium]